MRNVLARRAAKDTHEHGGHLGARGVVIRHHVAAGIAEQDTVIAGKIQRRLIPRAGRRRYGRRRGRGLGRRLRAGFGIGRGRRLRYGGGGLHGVRLCGDDRHDGQRQHARKHEQQRQKAFAHGFLLPVFLWGDNLIIPDGGDFSTYFPAISTFLSFYDIQKAARRAARCKLT